MPETIQGFGHVKERYIAQAREREAALLKQFHDKADRRLLTLSELGVRLLSWRGELYSQSQQVLMKVQKESTSKPEPLEPISARIRRRIEQAGRRANANDNIAEFIHGAEELTALEDEVAQRMQALLESLVIDTRKDHNTRGTARRVARMFLHEVFKGRYHHRPALTEFPNVERLNELMIVGPIAVRSACSHHFVPIIGKLWIGVLPNEKSNLIGLSKFSRVAEWVMSRPQIQEEAIIQLADLLERALRPDGLAIVLEADHLCTQWRGVKDNSHMTNSVMRGTFLANTQSRIEFLELIKK